MKSINKITLLLIGILFFILNHYTPLQHDDFLYMYQYGPTPLDRPSNIEISSLLDVIRSQFYHYQMVHGRFFSHVLIQIFCALFNKYIFDIINTCIFLFGIYLINLQIPNTTNRKNYVIYIYSATLLFFCIPQFGFTFLWLTGAINYLWAPILSLAFITIMNKERILDNHKITFPILFLLALFVNWMQESVSIGICFIYTLYFIYNHHYFKRHRIPLLLGLIIGSILLIFAPSNFVRAKAENVIEQNQFITIIANRLLNFIYFIIHSCWPLLIYIIYNLIYYKIKPYEVKPFFRKEKILIGSIIGNLLFVFLLGKTDARIATGIVFFTLTLIIKQTSSYICNCNFHKSLSLSFIVLFCFIYSFAVTECYAYYNFNNNRILNLNNYPSNEPFPYVAYSKESSHFTKIINWSPSTNDLHNRVMANYFNRKSFQAIPPSLYNRYSSSNFCDNTQTLAYSSNIEGSVIMKDNYDNRWIIPIPIEQTFSDVKVSYLEYTANDSNLKIHQKFIRTLLGTLNESNIKKSIGNSYYILKQNNYYIITDSKPTANEVIVELTSFDNQIYKIHFIKK